MTEQGVHKFKD